MFDVRYLVVLLAGSNAAQVHVTTHGLTPSTTTPDKSLRRDLATDGCSKRSDTAGDLRNPSD